MSQVGIHSHIRPATLGLLAIAAGSALRPAHASRIRCTVTAGASAESLESEDAFVNAMVDVAEFACGSEDDVVPISESISAVASAMAEATASVIGTCTGEGNAVAMLSGLANAEAQAEAVGQAAANVVAQAAFCQLCDIALESMISITENVTAAAVAEASIQEAFMFEEGDVQTMTVEDVQQAMEESIVEVLSTVTGEIRMSALDSCSGEVMVLAMVGDSAAECDVSVSADDIQMEMEALAEAGAAVQAMVCDGEASEMEITSVTRDVADAVATAVVLADSFCTSTGPPGTLACALSNGSVTAVAETTASAFFEAMANATGEDCDCAAGSALSGEMVATIVAEAVTAGMSEACVEGAGVAIASAFEMVVEEAMGVAFAEAIATAVSGAECNVTVTGCADAAQCVETVQLCAGPGVEGTLRCCEEGDVCSSLFGDPEFRCVSQDTVDSFPDAEVMVPPCEVELESDAA